MNGGSGYIQGPLGDVSMQLGSRDGKRSSDFPSGKNAIFGPHIDNNYLIKEQESTVETTVTGRREIVFGIFRGVPAHQLLASRSVWLQVFRDLFLLLFLRSSRTLHPRLF